MQKAVRWAYTLARFNLAECQTITIASCQHASQLQGSLAGPVHHAPKSLSTMAPCSTHHQKNRLLHNAAVLCNQAEVLRSVVQFPLAQTGEGIKECELIQWFVKVGDQVEMFDKVCEVQSDKAAVEITSRYAGTITHLHHSTGDLVQVGEPLVDIQLAGEDIEVAEAVPNPPTDAALQQHSSAMALPGDAHRLSHNSTHTATPPPHPMDSSSGILPVPGPSKGPSRGSSGSLASPAVRAIAREHSIDIAQVHGTGPGGRVLKGDVLAFLEGGAPQGPPEGVPAGKQQGVQQQQQRQQQPQPQTGTAGVRGNVTSVPLRGFRHAMVRSMEASNAVPHFHFCDEIDLTQLVKLRAALKADPMLDGAKLTFLPFILKALSEALLQYPDVNSSLAEDGRSLQCYDQHNIGVAVATPHGLVVPNIKGVQHKSLVQLAQEMATLQQQAAANKLPTEAITGGTITISNIGTIGGTYATPRVNPPESAILAMGKVQQLPRYAVDGSVQPAAIMRASWGADHRVVDGATLAQFSNAWKELLEAPERLLLRLK